jgi:hypothetical protein
MRIARLRDAKTVAIFLSNIAVIDYAMHFFPLPSREFQPKNQA